MAIAGIEPVAFATSELGSMRYAMTSLTNNSMEPISLPSGTELFTDEQVREILVKFSGKVEAFDEMEPPFVPDIDEFMKSGE